MKKINITKLAKDIGRGVSKHSPEILTGVGIAGIFTTVVLAVNATPKALELIEEEKKLKKEETPDADDVKLTKTETVKMAWKPYIPAAISGVVSIGCIIGANSVHARRNAALYSAYKLSETALMEFKDKAVEVVGEDKVKNIKQKIAEDKVDQQPVSNSEVIITEKGNVLCLDSVSMRYFKSDIETIKRSVNILNKRLLNEMYISLTDLYMEIGLSPTSISDDLGWNIDDDFDISFSSTIADDGTPCIVLDYHVAPRYDYTTLM